MKSKEYLGQKLTTLIPRDFLLTFQQLFPGAFENARQLGEGYNENHRKHVTGLMRHFMTNEATGLAFDESGIPHLPLRGNRALFGTIQDVHIFRIHMSNGKWDNSKRSKTKRQLCEHNHKVAAQIQMNLFEPVSTNITPLSVCLVTQGEGTTKNPAQAFVVVPDHNLDLRNPVFVEPMELFLQRYQKEEPISDEARPKLKAGIKSKTDESNRP